MSETTSTTEATPAEIRAWAKQQGIQVGARGTLSAEVKDAYAEAHGE